VDGVAFVFLDTLFPLVMYTFKKELMVHFDAVGALPKECFPWAQSHFPSAAGKSHAPTAHHHQEDCLDRWYSSITVYQIPHFAAFPQQALSNWHGEDTGEEARSALPKGCQFTRCRWKKPDGERFSQAMNGRFLWLTPISSVSPQNPCIFHPIYYIQLTGMQPDVATLTLPFADSLITIGTTMHGGAIASLIDTAAMVAAWSDDSEPDNMRGTTVSLAVTYLATAEHEDIQATARVLRRGRNLVYLDVEVQSLSGKSVARGLVTYKLG
jgi:uncharacterized protein (TIGR00369 family)